MTDTAETAAQQLLSVQPNLAFFYVLYLAYTTGSVGDSTFYALVTDPAICRATIQRLCAEQKAVWEAEVAEIKDLPEDEWPYDPLLPDGCSATLCIVLPDKERYVRIAHQHWYNSGQSLHPDEMPDIFDIAYYSEKVRCGDYRHDRVKS